MPKNTNNILLIGPMGSGKTSVAKLLANNLDKKFLDTDEEVMKKTGVDIAYIFDMEGEEGFRKRECLALKECLNHNNTVLSTGGGIVLAKENRDLLQNRGTVIFSKLASVHRLKEQPQAIIDRFYKTKTPNKPLRS
mgnify:CR=1 FL=1